jgi:hypothetical protein
MGYNVHDVLNKVVFLYYIKFNFKNKHFWVQFQVISIFQSET